MNRSHRFESLIPRDRVRSCIEHWIAEDCPSFDVAGAIVEAAISRGGRRQALITCKTAGAVICGLWLAQEIFAYLQCEYVCNPAQKMTMSGPNDI